MHFSTSTMFRIFLKYIGWQLNNGMRTFHFCFNSSIFTRMLVNVSFFKEVRLEFFYESSISKLFSKEKKEICCNFYHPDNMLIIFWWVSFWVQLCMFNLVLPLPKKSAGQ